MSDLSGSPGETAFDFDGNGLAEAMYADETTLFVFDASVRPLLTQPRDSLTGMEYPVVADVDNDGSAEIIAFTNRVTNVAQDGTIPAEPQRSWLGLNTFRSSAQIEDDGVCQPVPEG